MQSFYPKSAEKNGRTDEGVRFYEFFNRAGCSGRRGDRLFHVESTTETAAAIEHLPSKAAFHAGTKAELTGTLDLADTTGVMNGHGSAP